MSDGVKKIWDINYMTKLFDTLFYNFYIFYKKIMKDDDYLFSAAWAIGALIAFPIMDIGTALPRYLFLIEIGRILSYIIMFAPILIIVYYYYHNKRYISIIKTKPYIKSYKWSKYMSIIFFLIFLSMWFWLPMVTKSFLDKNNIVPERILNLSLSKGFYFTEWKKKSSAFPSLEEAEQWLEEKNKSSTE